LLSLRAPRTRGEEAEAAGRAAEAERARAEEAEAAAHAKAEAFSEAFAPRHLFNTTHVDSATLAPTYLFNTTTR
jgi:hypothetical protein